MSDPRYRITVFATTQFASFHQWPAAPVDCRYLRSPHRHVFHIRGEKQVGHEDRDVEFITLKLEIESAIQAVNGDTTIEWSCERWARYLIEQCKLTKCEVSEDAENGAIVEVLPDSS